MIVPMVGPMAMPGVAQPPAGTIIDVDEVIVDEVIVASRAVDDVVPAADDRTVASAGAIPRR